MVSPSEWASLASRSVATKYAQPEELEHWRRVVSQGLHPDESALVERLLIPGSRVLDVGCGAGREAIALAKRGFRVTAIDLVPAMIELARAEAAREGIRVTFEVKDVTALDYPEGAFEHVLFGWHVYAHIPGRDNRVETLRRVRNVLREGGTVVLSAYNRRAIRQGMRDRLRDFRRGLTRFIARNGQRGEPGDRWVRGVSEASRPDSPACFCHFATAEEVAGELREAGLRLNEVTTFEELVEGARLSSAERQRIPTLYYIAQRSSGLVT